MKKHFKGYYKLTNSQFKILWRDCLFSLDANILLNLYRYSESTRTELLQLLASFSDRLWVPNQAVQEYHNNRLDVISEESDRYDKTLIDLKKFYTNIEKSFKSKTHPYLENAEEYLSRFAQIISEIDNELEKSKKKYSDLLVNDSILIMLTTLLNNKVGDPYKTDELEQLYKEGKKRFDEKIPPGYRDKIKTGNKSYGDYIIWKQLIDKAIADKKPIIFVTAEKKEDWWNIHKKKTIGPRPELINEFNEKTGRQFYLYHINIFMESADEFLNQKVKQSAIEETKSIFNLDKIRMTAFHNEVSKAQSAMIGLVSGINSQFNDRYLALKKINEAALGNNLGKSLSEIMRKQQEAASLLSPLDESLFKLAQQAVGDNNLRKSIVDALKNSQFDPDEEEDKENDLNDDK